MPDDPTPVPNDSPGGPVTEGINMQVGTMLHGGSPDCPHCGAPPSEHEVRNHSLMWHDGDVHCRRCGGYVRMYDAG